LLSIEENYPWSFGSEKYFVQSQILGFFSDILSAQFAMNTFAPKNENARSAFRIIYVRIPATKKDQTQSVTFMSRVSAVIDKGIAVCENPTF